MKVKIDAGHYGKYNPSPCNSNYTEAERMWKYHLYLAEELNKIGVYADTTRQNEATDMGLVARGHSSAGYDLFISCHTNATAQGASTTRADWAAAYVAINGKADDIAADLIGQIDELLNGREWLGNMTNGDIKKNYCYKVKNNVGTDYYGVLRGATEVGTPSLILEHGFHTNPNHVEKLMNDDFLKNMARVSAQVIKKHLSNEAPEEPKQTLVDSPQVMFPAEMHQWCIIGNLTKSDPTLNVRTGPGTEFPNLPEHPLLGNGNGVTVWGQSLDANWAYVNIEGVFGWISAKYILGKDGKKATFFQAITAPDMLVKRTTAEVCNVPDGDKLNVRTKPNASATKVIGHPTLGNTNLVDILGYNANKTWAFINIVGVKGWVKATYLK